MTKEECRGLMRSSKTEKEWNTNCLKVKKACGGYPDYWFAEIIQSGLMERTLSTCSPPVNSKISMHNVPTK